LIWLYFSTLWKYALIIFWDNVKISRRCKRSAGFPR
jgi:hypothetical protein